MNEFNITAEPRSGLGRSATRKLRREGKVPAVVYGGGEPPAHVALSHAAVLKHLDDEAFYSHVLELDIDGARERVVLKDLQRHPFKPVVLHLDLLRVRAGEALTMRVPVHFLNEERCVGVKQQGGRLAHVLTELEVTCPPERLPEYVEVDVAGLEIGDAVHVGELTLPEGVAAAQGVDPDQVVVACQPPAGGAEEEEAGEELAAGPEAGQAGAEEEG